MLREHLDRVESELKKGNAGCAIAAMETLLSVWKQPQTAEKLNDVKGEYEVVVNYWRTQQMMPYLDEMYRKILHKLFVVYGNVAIYDDMQTYSTLKTLHDDARNGQNAWTVADIREEMETFVGNVAMLELEQPHVAKVKRKSLYDAHLRQMQRLFNFLLTARMWSEKTENELEELLLSPTVDVNDQQLLVTAITLSLFNQYDFMKFKLLVEVYRRSQEVAVRQRALVGWVLGMDEAWNAVYPEQRDMAGKLLQSDDVCNELTELQLQLVYCLNAERDTQKIKEEIMPDLKKNNGQHIMPGAIDENNDDAEQDMLHPEMSEERMEQMENSFRRMADMQQQGVDIYFGGFSQMKRWPFFDKVCNWFMPFAMEHPDLGDFVAFSEKHGFIRQMLQMGDFCNSDKYSLAASASHLVERMPAEILRMLDKGEAAMETIGQSGLPQTPERIRRAYLMDLYRFFRLCPKRSDFDNPFTPMDNNEMGACLFLTQGAYRGSGVEASKDAIVRLLRRQKMMGSARALLESYDEQHRNLQYYLWTGNYEAAYAANPNHERACVGRARQLFHAGRYEEAAALYDQLTDAHPEKTIYSLNRAVCLLYMKRYDDSLQLLYKLNYEQPDDATVSGILAWTLVCSGREQQAETVYECLFKAKRQSTDDWQNYGYCEWLLGKQDAAAACFRKHLALINGKKSSDISYFDVELLKSRGVKPVEIQLMYDLVFSSF